MWLLALLVMVSIRMLGLKPGPCLSLPWLHYVISSIIKYCLSIFLSGKLGVKSKQRRRVVVALM